MTKIWAMSVVNTIENFDDWVESLKEVVDHAVLFSMEEKFTKEIDDVLKKHNLKWIVLDNIEKLDSMSILKCRSILWNKLRDNASEGDWVFAIDSEEFMEPASKFLKKAILALDSNIDMIGFKILTMWDDTKYRADSIWTNYSIRAAKFIDKEFRTTGDIDSVLKLESAKGADGQFLPEYAYRECKNLWNSDIRICTYFLSSEEKREKFLENYNRYIKGKTGNWIMEAHYESIDGSTDLREITEKIYPTVEVCIPISSNRFKIDSLYNFVEMRGNYPGEMKIIFYLEEGNKLIQEIDKKITELKMGEYAFVQAVKIENSISPRSTEYALKKAIYIQRPKDEQGYTIIFDEGHPFDPTLINHMILTEKELVVDLRKNIMYAYAVKNSFLTKIDFDAILHGRRNDVIGILEEAKKRKYIPLGVGTGIPQFFVDHLGAVYSEKMPAFESSFAGINPHDYTR